MAKTDVSLAALSLVSAEASPEQVYTFLRFLLDSAEFRVACRDVGWLQTEASPKWREERAIQLLTILLRDSRLRPTAPAGGRFKARLTVHALKKLPAKLHEDWAGHVSLEGLDSKKKPSWAIVSPELADVLQALEALLQCPGHLIAAA